MVMYGLESGVIIATIYYTKSVPICSQIGFTPKEKNVESIVDKMVKAVLKKMMVNDLA